MTKTEKDAFDSSSTLTIFEEGLSLNMFDKRLKPSMYKLVTNLNQVWKLANCHKVAKQRIYEYYDNVKKEVDLVFGYMN